MGYTDYHVHTDWSYCCKAEGNYKLEDLIRLMPERNVENFVVTDHSSHFYFEEQDAWQFRYIEDPRLFQLVKKEGNQRVKAYIKNIRSFRNKGVRVGMEVDIALDGTWILDKSYRDELEVIIGAVHWLPCLKKGGDLERLKKEFLAQTLLILETGIDILAHPTRIFRQQGFSVPEEIIDPIIEKAISYGVALELNGHSRDPDEIFIKRCLEKGAKIVWGTDCHRLEEFGNFDFHRTILRKAKVLLYKGKREKG